MTCDGTIWIRPCDSGCEGVAGADSFYLGSAQDDAKWGVVLLTSDGIVWGIWVLVVRFLLFCLVVTKDLLKFVATKGY